MAQGTKINEHKEKTTHRKSHTTNKGVRRSNIPQREKGVTPRIRSTTKKQSETGKMPYTRKDAEKENLNVNQGIFLTQDVGGEMNANREDSQQFSDNEQHQEQTQNTQVAEEKSKPSEQTNEQLLRTTNSDRMVTKCSTDSGIADIETNAQIVLYRESDLQAIMRREYFKGLDNLRKIISDMEAEMDGIALKFYCCDKNNEDQYEEYLRKNNDKLLICNNILRKKQLNLEVIDSEIKIMTLLNKLRELRDDVNDETINHLTEFYEHLTTHLDKIHSVSAKYRNTVLKILQNTCNSCFNGNCHLEVSTLYKEEIKYFLQDIIQTLEHLDMLVKSYQNGIKQELFTNTNFSERVLICCDQKAFPILRIFPDICEKVAHVCEMSKQWIDKDQIYIQDINNHIYQTKSETRKKEKDLKKQQEKLNSMSNGTQEAYDLFKANKKELQKIEKRLKVVERRVEQCAISRNYLEEERRQKEGMVGFLEISITQTKKNTSLQLKRNRLQKQLKDLEESIRLIEQELSQVQQDLIRIQQERHTMEGKVEESSSRYTVLKTDLDLLTSNVEVLRKEMLDLSNSLTELEIIHNFKTSPEQVEDFYDRPASVKLAPSLKDKIKQKRRKKITSKKK